LLSALWRAVPSVCSQAGQIYIGITAAPWAASLNFEKREDSLFNFLVKRIVAIATILFTLVLQGNKKNNNNE